MANLDGRNGKTTGGSAKQGETMNEAHLELLRVLLSAPPMTVLVVLVLVWVFRSDLKATMSRIATIKFPGGELSTTSQADRSEKTVPPDEPPTGSTETALPKDLTLSPEQQELVNDFIQAQKLTSRIWEYRYLNFYFVRDTQLVLDWLVHNRPSIEFFHTTWMVAIPRAVEREAILSALEKHQLITGLETMIEITEKGRDYLQWRGPLPYFPSPKSS